MKPRYYFTCMGAEVEEYRSPAFTHIFADRALRECRAEMLRCVEGRLRKPSAGGLIREVMRNLHIRSLWRGSQLWRILERHGHGLYEVERWQINDDYTALVPVKDEVWP